MKWGLLLDKEMSFKQRMVSWRKMGLLASLERRKIQDQMSLDLMQLKVEYFG